MAIFSRSAKTSSQAIVLVAAFIVGGSIVYSSYMGRYELATSDLNGSPVAWRLDRGTGTIVPCIIAAKKAKQPPNVFDQLPDVVERHDVDKIAVECGK